METIHNRLDDILEKAEYLAEKSRMLAEANLKLNARIAELEGTLAARDKALEESKGQLEVLRLAKTIKGDGNGEELSSGNEELRERIDEYIREIDQCLKLIGD